MKGICTRNLQSPLKMPHSDSDQTAADSLIPCTIALSARNSLHPSDSEFMAKVAALTHQNDGDFTILKYLALAGIITLSLVLLVSVIFAAAPFWGVIEIWWIKHT